MKKKPDVKPALDRVKLKDGDYVLAEGAAWFSIGELSFRIAEQNDGSVSLEIYKEGEETSDAVAKCRAINLGSLGCRAEWSR